MCESSRPWRNTKVARHIPLQTARGADLQDVVGRRAPGLLWNKYWVNTLSQSALISVCVPLCVRFYKEDAKAWSQNRAYAANQLSDLHQKLTKAQTSISSTRPPAPVLIDEKAVIKQKPQDKREESALSKAVKDRSA